jgi:fumarate reductase iron-sulfur subunit
MSLLRVDVWRGRADGHYQRFEVPREESQTVLDVVTYIQRHLEPTLAYRFACRVGMCGSCAMTVNGVARWTCRTHVAKVASDDRLEIGPLRNLPVIRDLATDMREFFDKWARARGQFAPTATRRDDPAPVAPESRERAAANAGIECIGCGVCYASCDVVAWNPDYLGRRRSTAPGPWSTTFATPRAPSACARCRATRGATPAIRTWPAPSAARSNSRPRRRLPG